MKSPTEEHLEAMNNRRELIKLANDKAYELLDDPAIPQTYDFSSSRITSSRTAFQNACDIIRDETGHCPMEALKEEEVWLRGPEMAPVLYIDHLDNDGNPVYEKRK